jgi:hypothetical protein
VNNYKRTEEDYIKVNEELRKCGTIQANKIKWQNTIIRELRQELKRKDSELKDIKLELIMLKRRR